MRHHVCDKCGKGVNIGHNVSHAKNRTRHISLPNLHNARVIVDGAIEKQRLCTSCLRMAVRPVNKADFQKKQ